MRKFNNKEWGYGMDEERIDGLLDALSRHYKDAYMKEEAYDWEATEAAEPKPRYDFNKMLREVMIELHRSGQDTFMALKNDQLRDWWTGELAKIKKEEAKLAAREKAKSLLSEEERKLLGMKF